MQQLNISAGTPMLIGAPKPPVPPDRVRSLVELAKASSLVREAHLPRCYAPSVMKEPALVLVVVFEQAGHLTIGLKELDAAFSAAVAEEGYVQVWALLTNDPLIDTLRQADCQIFKA